MSTIKSRYPAAPATKHSVLWVVLSYGFRGFFLAAGLFAVVAIVIWLALLHGYSGLVLPANPILWHAHEMFFGFVVAAIAGFMLTAVPMWTGQTPLQGAPLGILLSTWLAGRLVMLAGGILPAVLVAVIDLLFPSLLAFFIIRMLIAGANKRNYPLGVLITLLPLANLAYHLGVLELWQGAQYGIYAMPHLAALLITIIGGRIIPAFTANWFKLQGIGQLPRTHAWLEYSCIGLTLLTAIAMLIAAQSIISGTLAAAAAVLHGLRLSGWRGLQTLTNPLLAILHLGYAWLAIAYLLLSLSVFTNLISHSGALHALTIGAIGTMILAVMSRVGLGHTARPLQAAWIIVIAYGLLSLAACARIFAALWPSYYGFLIDLSGLAWIIAFAAFSWIYWPILTCPRIDGKAER